MNTELKNSIDYITKKIGKNTCFTTPTNYFDGIETRFSNQILEDKLPKKENFSVPNNYFNSLEDNILDKVSSLKKETKIITLRSRIIRFAPFAAAAAILLFIGINNFTFNTVENVNFDSISDSDIENWLVNNANNVNNDDLTFVAETIDLDDSEFLSNSINDSDLEEYLNSFETTSLLNE
ncbi:hypothetical protein BTO04_01190 [Polaribacter sp. SA4-10]|uniref:hypothetical protein n=1 Tax=Polaribacter sp. SA4-10 TaxID=754397 RepID=UPI000B3CEEAC|nr:hypothetical protein [Polaribacter sp. SA4-10]ARV05388.1 hypothetical protein BTO04_01190 [Polaribacter sp. SA4-10]